MELDFDIETKCEALDFDLEEVHTVGTGGGLNEEEVREIVKEETSDLQPLTEIDASVDEEAFTLTLSLKDKNGEELSSKTVILPSKNVQIDLSNFVKKTDYATTSVAGIVVVGSGLVMSNTSHKVNVQMASETGIAGKTSSYTPIVPKNMDYAWKVSATTNTETWTDEEKAKVRALLGIE